MIAREIAAEQDQGDYAPNNFIRQFLSRRYEFARLYLHEPVLQILDLFGDVYRKQSPMLGPSYLFCYIRIEQ